MKYPDMWVMGSRSDILISGKTTCVSLGGEIPYKIIRLEWGGKQRGK